MSLMEQSNSVRKAIKRSRSKCKISGLTDDESLSPSVNDSEDDNFEKSAEKKCASLSEVQNYKMADSMAQKLDQVLFEKGGTKMSAMPSHHDA